MAIHPGQTSRSFIEIKAVTRQKDSHGLFDYKTNSLSIQKFIVDSPCKIYRNEKEVLLNMNAEPNSMCLTQVYSNSDDQFFIEPASEAHLYENENYLIIRSLKNKEGIQKGYALEPGDVLKLGRIEYTVIEFRNEEGQIHQIKDLFCTVFVYKSEIYQDAQLVQRGDLNSNVNKACKICLFDGQSDEDPIITPCKCSGTCEFVHFQCQKTWIESKCVKKQSDKTITIKWKRLECEVCQAPLPKQIQINGIIRDLAEIERPTEPYIILESISEDKKFSKGLVLIRSSLDEPVKLGRDHQCEMRISDISVSRVHAFIKYENRKFVIIDNNSKFGTLVRIQKPFRIDSGKLAIQIGRTVLKFILKQSNSEPDSQETTIVLQQKSSSGEKDGNQKQQAAAHEE